MRKTFFVFKKVRTIVEKCDEKFLGKVFLQLILITDYDIDKMKTESKIHETIVSIFHILFNKKDEMLCKPMCLRKTKRGRNVCIFGMGVSGTREIFIK